MSRIGPRASAGALALGLLAAATVVSSPHARADVGLHRTSDVLAIPGSLLGPAPGERRMNLQLSLTDPWVAQEEALTAALVDPASPLYRKFLTPAQYATRFAIPATERATVTDWLRAGGLHVERVSGTGDRMSVSGTVGAVQRLLSVHLSQYQAAGHTFLANDVAPLVPAPVRAVIGLNTWHRFAPVHPPRTSAVRPQVGLFAGNIDVHQLWTAYDAPAGDEGQGVRIGVFMAGNTDPVTGSLRVFEDREKLPRVPVRVVRAQPGPVDQFGANDGADEWELDTQSATGMAPQVSELDLYTAKSLEDGDIIAEFAYWADDPTGPDYMNASFGGCEASPLSGQISKGGAGVALGNQIQDAIEKSLRQAFTEGRTVFAASGDTGSSCTPVSLPVVGGGNGVANQVYPAQLYPAASPYVTAVGGTVVELGKDGARKSEEAWAFGGGGSALFIARPSWQATESAVNRPCLLMDADGVAMTPGTTCRGVPDIAAMSGNNLQGLKIIGYDAPSMASGTSLASPLAMGSWARVAAAVRNRLGPVAPVLYRLTAEQRAGDFFDITKGELVGNGLNVPGPGWDYTSGYGVLDIAHLARDLGGRTTPVHPAGPARVPDPPTGTLTGNKIACLPFGTSPVGNVGVSALGDPGTSLDITSATMTSSPDGKSLVITVSGPALSPQPPLGASLTTINVHWVYDGKTWAADTDTGPGGQPVGSVRSITPSDDPVPTSAAKDTRTVFSAKWEDHSLIMTIPLSAIGSPPPGARLSEPVALAGSDGGVGDVAGPQYDYTVGQRCKR